jgi:hypothetical protein
MNLYELKRPVQSVYLGLVCPRKRAMPARRKVYLHWSATGYDWAQPGHYHSIINGNGVVQRMHDYNIDLTAHTYRRNTNSIGIACACMGGSNDPWTMPPKSVQLEAMCREVARIISNWGWSEAEITVQNILTHAEAAANRDGVVMHVNYGPVAWGGTGERWDFMCLTKNGPDTGGDKIREMIRDCYRELQSGGSVSAAPASHPLANSAAKEMSAKGESLKVLIDANGTSWAKVSELLNLYKIPYLWDADKRRILLGSSSITPRYSQDQVVAKPDIPSYEMTLQGSNSPVILVGLVYNDSAYCRVLEFAEELGISASFNPFALQEMRGG